MKFIISITFLAILISCQENKKEVMVTTHDNSFFVGTYTDGESKGIYKYKLEQDGTLKSLGLVAKTENPSFLTKSADGKYLVAVNEISNQDSVGTVSAFRIQKDSLRLINSTSSGGAHPCFVSVNNDGYILTANYTGGNIGLLKLDANGNITGPLDIQQHVGSDITARQKAPHAHSAWFSPKANEIIAVDLGTNALWFSKLDTLQLRLQASNPNTLKMKPGAGPRHLTFHPNGIWIYVLNELDATITLVKRTDDESYEKVTSISTLPEGYIEANSSADIHITWAGKFVYASNRGHNSIAIYNVNELDGSLTLVGHEPTRGDGPRNFSLSPDENYLLVANQKTNNIVSYRRDRNTGLLTYVHEIEAPAPVCILF